jgi:hypothetical protein
MTLDVAKNMPVRLRVDNSNVSQPYAVVTTKTCVRQGNFNRCEAFLPVEVVTRLNVPGKHQLFAFAYDGWCCESLASDPRILTTPK